jgi:hypothetical protein
MNTASRFSLSLVLLASAVGCHGGNLDVGSANVAADAGPGEGGRPLPEGAIAQLEERVSAIAVDRTHVYLGGDGHVYSVPKTGGAVTSLVHDEPARSTPKTAVAVDDTHVYFSNIDWARVARVPKGGGPAETVADHLGYPHEMVMDATHVYISVEDSFLPGSPPGPAIVRAPKSGGPVELVAGGQPAIGAMALHRDDIYFGGGYGVPDGDVRRVPKAGGAVEVLVTQLDTRPRPGEVSSSASVESLRIFGDRLAFSIRGRLTLAPLTGGAIEPTPLMIGDLIVDGSSLIVATLDTSTWTGSLQRVNALGASEATLARWVYPPTENLMASISPAAAMTTDGERTFWVDFDNHTASTTEPIRSTVRSAPLR